MIRKQIVTTINTHFSIPFTLMITLLRGDITRRTTCGRRVGGGRKEGKKEKRKEEEKRGKKDIKRERDREEKNNPESNMNITLSPYLKSIK